MSNTVPANALYGPIPIPAYDTFTFSTTIATTTGYKGSRGQQPLLNKELVVLIKLPRIIQNFLL